MGPGEGTQEAGVKSDLDIFDRYQCSLGCPDIHFNRNRLTFVAFDIRLCAGDASGNGTVFGFGGADILARRSSLSRS